MRIELGTKRKQKQTKTLKNSVTLFVIMTRNF